MREWKMREDGSMELVREDNGRETFGDYREMEEGNQDQIPMKVIELMNALNERKDRVFWDTLEMIIHKPGIDTSSGLEFEFKKWTVAFKWEEKKE